MSMFHELMMRKKEEIMYATIKGSLTDTDGIISGFINTGANYLQIDNINKLSSANSWEITIKIVNSSGSYFIGTNLERILTISAGTSKLYLSSNGISWDIANGVGLNTAIPNDSYVRLRFTGTQYILDYSSDLTNWTSCATITSSTKISNAITSLVIGKWWSGNVNFTGSIDLSNSYIKLGSTKYNLQAVVGYTIVGSPTITDGVVSGFSANDYLKFVNNLIASNYNKTEIVICLTTPNSFSALNTFLALGINYFYFNTNRKISAQIRLNNANKWVDCQTALSLNTKYWIKIISDTVNNSLQILYSTDGINFVLDGENTSLCLNSDFGTTKIGARDTSFFQGSIDLNSTYIKINNKLWFNGQQA